MADKASRFSRIRENEAKLGAYYTEISHCIDLGKMFRFPEKEVCVLEPCIGDASAVIGITDAKNRPNIRIFGVELNNKVAKETKKNPLVTELLEADFTCDVMIRKNSFSFCFANPPYMDERSDMDDSRGRMERTFLERILNYLKIDGVLVWIVPEHEFLATTHLRLWHANFETLACYRFRDQEYAKYKQIAVIGRRLKKRETQHSSLQAFYGQIQEITTTLPSDLVPSIEVYPSDPDEIDLFANRVFSATAALDHLSSKGIPQDLRIFAEHHLSQPRFTDSEIKRPPIPLKKDSLYLLATSGAGQGMTGSIENRDLHLQRGVAEVVEEENTNETEEKEATTLTVTTRTAISMHVIENNGTITTLV